MDQPQSDLQTKQERQRDWRAIQEAVEIEKSKFLVVPNDFEVKDITDDLERAIDKNYLLRAERCFHDAESFVFYLNKYKEDDTLVLIDATEKPKVQGVIDYHTPYENRELVAKTTHKAFYTPKLSRDWLAWLKNDGERLSQYDFALFLEDQIESISEPSGAEMLQTACRLKIIRKARFSKGVNINTGEIQFSFTNENERGTIEIPSEFKIVLQVFEYGEHYELTARLRYRLNDDHLRLWYELRRPDRAMDKAVEALKKKLQDSLDNSISIVMGDHI